MKTILTLIAVVLLSLRLTGQAINNQENFPDSKIIKTEYKYYPYGSFGPRLSFANLLPLREFEHLIEFEPSVSLAFEYSIFLDRNIVEYEIDTTHCSIVKGPTLKKTRNNSFFSIGHNVNFNSSYLFGGFELYRQSSNVYYIPLSIVGFVQQNWSDGTQQLGLGFSAALEFVEQGGPDSSPELAFVSLMFLPDFNDRVNNTLSISVVIPVNLGQWDGFVIPGRKNSKWIPRKKRRNYCFNEY